MIEVKIARHLHREGVDGVRWVLLDPPDGPAGGRELPGLASPAGATPQSVAQPGVAPGTTGLGGAMARRADGEAGHVPLGQTRHAGDGPRQALMLGALKSLVVVLALGAAMATAWRVIGPPRWAVDGAASGVRPAGPAVPPAGASAPVVTAWRSAQQGQR